MRVSPRRWQSASSILPQLEAVLATCRWLAGVVGSTRAVPPHGSRSRNGRKPYGSRRVSRGQSLFRPIFLGVNKNLDVSGQIADPDGSGTAVRGNDMQPASSPGQKRTLKRIQKEFFLPRSKEKKCENFLVLCAPCLAKDEGGGSRKRHFRRDGNASDRARKKSCRTERRRGSHTPEGRPWRLGSAEKSCKYWYSML